MRRFRPARRGPAPVVLAIVAWLAASPVSAQDRCFTGSVETDAGCAFSAPRWVGEFASLSANGLIGGLTAGLVRHFRGGSFGQAFMRGALGGAVGYAGKRVAAERFGGAGLLGRSLAAAGTSVVRNAAEAVPPFSRLTLPAGPVWLEIGPDRGLPRVRVDAVALGWIVYGVLEDELRFDAGESVSAGTPVFRTDGKLLALGGDRVHAGGVTNAGVIFLSDVPAFGETYERRSFAHERIHVVQEDQLAILWTDPAGRWASGRVAALEPAGRFLAMNLSTELLRLLGRLIPDHEERPWELESIFLAR